MSQPLPSRSLVLVTYVIYALHAFSAVTGLLTPAFIITAFLTGWPSLLAVFLSYLNRHAAHGSYLASHFDFVIKTFWLALLWLIVSGLCIISFIGILPGIVILLMVGVWVLYRLLKGMSALINEKPVSIT